MKRLVFTLLVSVAGFAATVTFGSPDAGSDETSLGRPEKTKTALWSLPATRSVEDRLEQAAV